MRLSRLHHLLLIAILMISIVCGCDASNRESAVDVPGALAGSSSTAAAVSSDSSDATDIRLTPVDRAKFDAVIAAHHGKVVLADFWATWCGPCVEQFPHTVELHRQMDPAQVAVVSVSMDEPEDRAKVLGFLQEQGATFDNLISEYGVGVEGFTAFEITDGAIPHYKVYDQSGKLRQTVNSNEKITQIIQQLLDE